MKWLKRLLSRASAPGQPDVVSKPLDTNALERAEEYMKKMVKLRRQREEFELICRRYDHEAKDRVNSGFWALAKQRHVRMTIFRTMRAHQQRYDYRLTPRQIDAITEQVMVALKEKKFDVPEKKE